MTDILKGINNDMGYKGDWLRNYWRPMMAIVYMAVVIFDFIIGPVFWSIMQFYGGSVSVQWVPLTLSDAGVFHVAMGGVLGISAFTRGKEKIERIRRGESDSRVNDQDSEFDMNDI
jgi:hypothetical protein